MNKIDLENDIHNGLSQHQMAKKHDKSQTTIGYWLKKFLLKTRNSQIGNGYISVPKKENRYSVPRKRKSWVCPYDKIDWNRCQQLHNEGLTWKDLTKRGFPHNGLEWAVKAGKLTFRTTSESVKLAHNSGKYNYSVYRTPIHRKIMSKFGGLKPRAGRCKKVLYTKLDKTTVWLQGSWEVKFAEYLDSQNVKWEKNKIGYKYTFDGKEHNYFPDFFLSKKNVFVEVKGYETNKDVAKWKQFPYKLFVVKKQEIQNLDVWYNETYQGFS